MPQNFRQKKHILKEQHNSAEYGQKNHCFADTVHGSRDGTRCQRMYVLHELPSMAKAKAKGKGQKRPDRSIIKYFNTGRHTYIYLPEVKVCDPKPINNRELHVASWLLHICKLQKHHCTQSELRNLHSSLQTSVMQL